MTRVGTNMAALGKTVMFIEEVLEESAENAVVTRMPVPLVVLVLLANNKRRTVPKVNTDKKHTSIHLSTPSICPGHWSSSPTLRHVDATYLAY